MTIFKRFAKGGPVGIVHALREAWTAHQIRHVSMLMERERSLHLEHTAQLRGELNRLVLRQANAAQRAAAFWRAL